MYNSVFDVLVAGTDTSKSTLSWCFIFLSRDVQLQQELRQQVDSVMQDGRAPMSQDRDDCPTVTAFIAEVMRYRPIVPFGVTHRTTSAEMLDGQSIPKGTSIMVSLYHAMHDREAWSDPEVFRPNRFLDADGKFTAKPNNLYIPFSDGRRSCPGNRLATAELFLIICRFLQRTHRISVVGGVTADLVRGDLTRSDGWIPVSHRLQVVLRDMQAV